MLKTYTCDDFIGYYPVGVAAVMVAEDKRAAIKLFEAALKERGLEQKIDPKTVLLLTHHKPQVYILADGNY